MAEAALMDRRKNPFFEHAEVEHFLARRGRRVVGRIAAVENRLQCLLDIAPGVGVVDAQNETAAVVAREQPVEQRRTSPAYVEVAGGGGGKTDTYLGLGHGVRGDMAWWFECETKLTE